MTAVSPPPRVRAAAVVYTLLLAAVTAGCAVAPAPNLHGERPSLVAFLAAMAACDYFASRHLRLEFVYDMGIALALIGLVLAGPLAAFAIAVLPDVIHLARRRRAFWNAGLAANVASWGAAALAGAAVLGLARHAGYAPGLLAAGLTMLAVNYLVARLTLAAVRDRRPVMTLIREEFIAMLPLEIASMAFAAVAALLLPILGPLVLAGFALLVYMPQVTFDLLMRAPSVAAMSVSAAAGVYRAAIADELGLSRRDRRVVEQTAALVARHPEGIGATANPLALVHDALVATICLQTSPRQPAYTASPRAQVVVLAQRWAELTARCTPALSHREAMGELALRPAARDAPEALAAARAIVEREHAFSTHIAGVPRLHRVPVPRTVRRRYLPDVVARLTA